MGVLHFKDVDAIAVVLALEDYQNSIAKNLRVRDITVDIYGLAMVSPRGRDIFSHQTGGEIVFSPGRGGNLFVHQTGGEIFHFFKAKQYKLINEDLVSGESRI